MKSNIKWIAAFFVVIIICAIIILVRKRMSDTAVVAHIVQGGKILYKIDLSKVDDPYELSIGCDDGNNTIRVEKGRICVIDADCPDKICVKTGYISDSQIPIVCLPHKLSIMVTGADGSYDAVAGGQ